MALTDGVIAFERNQQIKTINPDGTGVATLTTTGYSFAPSFSPDGTKIASTHDSGTGQQDLWIMNADGSDKTQVTTTGGASKGGASWSPDGAHLAFGGPCISTHAVPCSPSDGIVLDTVSATAPYGSPVTVGGDEDQGGPPDDPMNVLDLVAWSADGDGIAFASDGFTGGGNDQFLVAFQLGAQSVRFVDYLGAASTSGKLANPAFSFTGDRLAYDAKVRARRGPCPQRDPAARLPQPHARAVPRRPPRQAAGLCACW